MAFDADLRSALDTRLFAVSGIPASTHRAGENAKHVPTVREVWLRRTLLYGSRDRLTAPAQGAYVQEQGLFLVDLFYPELTGPSAADTLARNILAAFPPGLTLLAGSIPVQIERSQRRGGLRDDGTYHVPLEIAWWVVTAQVVT